MIGLFLIVGSLVALVQAKAIITNHCPQPAYVWSVPNVDSAYAVNLRIESGKRYEEPWRYGTAEHPGIALKVSFEPNGIHTGKPELDFAYGVSNKTGVHHVWNDLSSIRSDPFDYMVSFHNCHGSHNSWDVQPSRCSPDEDTELVLCGSTRTSPALDSVSPAKITDCFAYHPGKSDGTKSIDAIPKPTTTSGKPVAVTTDHAKASSASMSFSSQNLASYFSSLMTKVSVKTSLQQPPEKTSSASIYKPAQINSTVLSHSSVLKETTTTTVTEHTTVTKTGHETHTATLDRPVPQPMPTDEQPYPLPAASRPSPPPHSRHMPTPDSISVVPRPAYLPHGDRPISVVRHMQVAGPRDLEYCKARIV